MVIVEDLTKWQELVNERDALQWKLDHANVRFYLFFSLFVLFCFFFAFSLFYYYKESLIFLFFYFSLKIIT